MSKALPGSHFCVDHQGNHSHYAKHNCELCVALAEVAALDERLTYAGTSVLVTGTEKIAAENERDALRAEVAAAKKREADDAETITAAANELRRLRAEVAALAKEGGK